MQNLLREIKIKLIEKLFVLCSFTDGPQREQEQQQQRQQKLSKNDIQLDDKCESKISAESADMYIATHGGCLHHYKPLQLCRSLETDEEFDI